MELDVGNLENLQVELVKQSLEEVVRGDGEVSLPEGFCTCRFCLVDVVAVALNSLPPRYVADKYSKFPDSPAGEDRALETARRAVALAVKRVARRPKHDR